MDLKSSVFVVLVFLSYTRTGFTNIRACNKADVRDANTIGVGDWLNLGGAAEEHGVCSCSFQVVLHPPLRYPPSDISITIHTDNTTPTCGYVVNNGKGTPNVCSVCMEPDQVLNLNVKTNYTFTVKRSRTYSIPYPYQCMNWLNVTVPLNTNRVSPSTPSTAGFFSKGVAIAGWCLAVLFGIGLVVLLVYVRKVRSVVKRPMMPPPDQPRTDDGWYNTVSSIYLPPEEQRPAATSRDRESYNQGAQGHDQHWAHGNSQQGNQVVLKYESLNHSLPGNIERRYDALQGNGTGIDGYEIPVPSGHPGVGRNSYQDAAIGKRDTSDKIPLYASGTTS